jgi:hypothetical protein
MKNRNTDSLAYRNTGLPVHCFTEAPSPVMPASSSLQISVDTRLAFGGHGRGWTGLQQQSLQFIRVAETRAFGPCPQVTASSNASAW